MLEKSSYTNSRNITLATFSSVPPIPAIAGILLVHGYAEHTGRYIHVINELNERGYAVFAVEHEGHGNSEGTRSDIKHFDYFVDDLNGYFNELKNNTGIRKWFVMGQSMGGAIALKFAIRNQEELSGMILTGPMLQFDVSISKFIKLMVRYAAAIVPAVPVMKLETEALSRDPDVVKKYTSDPLVYGGRVRARMAIHFDNLTREMPELVREVRLPFWTGHGTLDRITSPRGSKMLYEESPSVDKTLKLFDGLFHEILNEPEKDQVIGEICFWIKRQLDKNSGRED